MSQWPHAPPHHLCAAGAYMVTSGTYGKAHLFRDPERLDFLHDLLLDLATRYGWTLEAWAVFSNHYHFVASSPEEEASSMKTWLRHLHSQSARELNQLDGEPGRQVWHNYCESHLTYERSYYARLHYVHANAVRHGLVTISSAYPWCSASWFERNATPAQVAKIYSFPIDRLSVDDDF